MALHNVVYECLYCYAYLGSNYAPTHPVVLTGLCLGCRIRICHHCGFHVEEHLIEYVSTKCLYGPQDWYSVEDAWKEGKYSDAG